MSDPLKAFGIRPPYLPVMDMEPMPPPIASLVPEAISTPAPPPSNACSDTAMQTRFAQFATDNGIPPGGSDDLGQAMQVMQAFSEQISQECPDYAAMMSAFAGGAQIQISGSVQLGPGNMTQSSATAKLTNIVQANAIQATISAYATPSGAPPPTPAPVAPSALPSSGVIVGAALGVAALLLLV